MTNYAENLRRLSDEQLADQMAGGPQLGSVNHELIKFEMQRRVAVAQKLAADATLRGAIAAERYTRATWVLLILTLAGLVANLLR